VVQVVVRAQGFETVFALFNSLGNAKWDELLRRIGSTVEEQTINHFQTQSGPEGPWPSTQRGGAALVLTGRLRGSISHIVSGEQVAIGTNVFYGKFHQTGTSRTPRRMFLGLNETDKEELRDVVVDFISSLVRGG
jgi:phage gpG-like protein